MTDEAAPKAASAPAPEAPITLAEFCTEHSKVAPSIELLNAFFALEERAGRTSATRAQFVTRLADFAARPAV